MLMQVMTAKAIASPMLMAMVYATDSKFQVVSTQTLQTSMPKLRMTTEAVPSRVVRTITSLTSIAMRMRMEPVLMHL